MACITERKRADGTTKWQAIIRVKGHPAIIQTFETLEAAQRFVADTEPALKQNHKKAELALQKQRRKQPAVMAFYERPLKDVIKDYAYGAIDPETGKRPGEELAKHSQSTTPKVTSSKRRAVPEHLQSLGAHWGHFETVLKYVGDVLVGNAKSAWVLSYVDKMRRKESNRKQPYSLSTIGKHLGLMRAACEAAALRADVEDPRLYFSMKKAGKSAKNGRDRRLEGNPPIFKAR